MDPRTSLYDYERDAALRLERSAFDYFAGGAGDEITVRENVAAYDRLAFRYRVLRSTAAPDLSTQVLGRRLPHPVLFAPTAFARLAHPDGELAISRAARATQTVHVLSTLSTVTLEEVAGDADPPPWFQLYVFRDRGLTRELVARASEARYDAIVLTVDAPVLGRRDRDARSRFALPAGMLAANLSGAGKETIASGGGSGLLEYFAAQIDPALAWSDVEWLCAETSLPVIVKGIVRGDDACAALQHGCRGVVVSNHGGRQLDTAIATIDALPEVCAAVGGSAAVLVDGGIRRGQHIAKALAIGADAVLIGRPVIFGLAAAGQAGVEHTVALLLDELRCAMQLCGARERAELTPDLVARR
jgi:4-hydroxymandelate oxidase